ncbi:8-oxo-dGTP pyrophosphatase MutT, NUDIX family [Ruegeria halocynthiae]|uniref:8-oxo-dGTP pyrophosphatase MutT, NUDIX family n=1 Tax=Ruegeria halocynthiae TaxID=985054 RepID=A0A1H2R8M6_9RHOB|nr:NUDIX hydrolase [Ruegeria halocynthiae]SDW15823.1 8-oxo-dGTP pyrophosphatase MutT, NUDIX family [Ruegeria halocynthiae]
MTKWIRNIWEEVARPLFQRPRRVQVAALCTRKTGPGDDVLLITSRGTGRWIIPKGWPIDGLNGPESALQEAWEEAGVRAAGVPKEPVGHYSYDKKLDDGSAQQVVTSVYHIEVSDLADEYPEADQRTRCWVSPKVAAERVQEPELRDLLLQM